MDERTRRWKTADQPWSLSILTHGESHASRWFQTYNEVSLILDPRFLADVVEDGLPADRIRACHQRFSHRRCHRQLRETFRTELAADAPNGLLYAETLTIGLALHLLANYGVETPKGPAPWQGRCCLASCRPIPWRVARHSRC